MLGALCWAEVQPLTGGARGSSDRCAFQSESCDIKSRGRSQPRLRGLQDVRVTTRAAPARSHILARGTRCAFPVASPPAGALAASSQPSAPSGRPRSPRTPSPRVSLQAPPACPDMPADGIILWHAPPWCSRRASLPKLDTAQGNGAPRPASRGSLRAAPNTPMTGEISALSWTPSTRGASPSGHLTMPWRPTVRRLDTLLGSA
jgi:hypothetical protein